MQKSSYYGWVKEVVEEREVEKVNELLSKGYRLLSIREKMEVSVSDRGSSQKTSVVYILGKGYEVDSNSEEVWRKNPDGTEWAYAKDVPEYLLKKAESPYFSNGYIYWLSKTKRTVKRALVRPKPYS